MERNIQAVDKEEQERRKPNMSTSIYDIASNIVFGGTIQEKLESTPLSQICFDENHQLYKIPQLPTRSSQIKISEDQVKFPKKFNNKIDIAKSMHFFANHELLAIEMMAMALLIFPKKSSLDQKFHKKIYTNLVDEQKHFSLYLRYMEEQGITIGDYPMNNHFWKYMPKLENLEQFFAVIALTFEAANLDFAKHYKNLFFKIEDIQAGQIMEEVYLDEIKHVQCGYQYLSQKTIFKSDVATYYQSLLPAPLTPARSKGNIFDNEGRKKAKMEPEFIQYIKNYRDNFPVTHRRQWKQEKSI